MGFMLLKERGVRELENATNAKMQLKIEYLLKTRDLNIWLTF